MTTATISIRRLTESGHLSGNGTYTHEQVLDAAARKFVEENPECSRSSLYNALSDECDMAAQIALDGMDLSEYLI